jgi:acetylornithine deacetylase
MSHSSTIITRIREAFDAGHALGLLQKGISILSVTGDEANFAGWLKGELVALGIEASHAEFAEGRPNVWGLRQGRSGADTLLLIGHTDTVHTRGWKERWAGSERESPYSGAVADGAVWGRGASDLKAGICMTLEAVRTLDRAGIKVDPTLLFAFVGDEESGEPGSGVSAGARALSALIARGAVSRPDMAIYVEPTMLDVYVAHMGFFLCDIRVVGKSAYFGVPELGVDALRGAHAVLEALWRYSAELSASAKHALAGSGFVLPTGIQGGGYIAVPGECTISMIAKTPPGARLDDVRADLETAARAASMEAASNCSFFTRRLGIIRSAANLSRAASTKRAWDASFLLFAPFVLSGEILKPLPIGRGCRYSRRSAFREFILRRGISGSATRRKRTSASWTITTASSPSLRFYREPTIPSQAAQSKTCGARVKGDRNVSRLDPAAQPAIDRGRDCAASKRRTAG